MPTPHVGFLGFNRVWFLSILVGNGIKLYRAAAFLPALPDRFRIVRKVCAKCIFDKFRVREDFC
jgi:hypothetical protein